VKRAVGLLVLAAAAALAQNTPQKFDELSSEAQKAYEDNRLDEAVRLYSQAVGTRPEWAEGWWALGMINYEGDHYPECCDALTRMVKLDASAAPGWALLGLCEFRTHEYDASFKHLKEAHMLMPNQQAVGQLMDMADFHLTMLLIRQGAFELAQEIMVRVAREVRNNPDMMFAAGLASLRMPVLPSEVPASQRDVVTMAGRTFWDLYTEKPAEAEADFTALLAKYPNFPNVHYFYGTHLASVRPELAVPQFLEELRLNSDSAPARVQLALRFTLDGKLDEAVKWAREAVALSPDSVGPQLALAQALNTQGNYRSALSAYLEAKRLDPVSPRISLYLANCYRALGQLDDMRREDAEYNWLKVEQANWP
jgi:tetratricopeptide (TPR) repeat protein